MIPAMPPAPVAPPSSDAGPTVRDGAADDGSSFDDLLSSLSARPHRTDVPETSEESHAPDSDSPGLDMIGLPLALVGTPEAAIASAILQAASSPTPGADPTGTLVLDAAASGADPAATTTPATIPALAAATPPDGATMPAAAASTLPDQVATATGPLAVASHGTPAEAPTVAAASPATDVAPTLPADAEGDAAAPTLSSATAGQLPSTVSAGDDELADDAVPPASQAATLQNAVSADGDTADAEVGGDQAPSTEPSPPAGPAVDDHTDTGDAEAGRDGPAPRATQPARETIAPAPVATSTAATDATPTVHAVSGPAPAAPTSPPQVTPPVVRAPVEPPVVHEQIVRRISDLRELTDGRRELTLDLDPADLGPLRMSIVVDQGKLHIQIDAQNASTRQLLGDSLDDLRHALAQAGVDSGEVGVGGGEGDHDDPSGSSRGTTTDDAIDQPTPTAHTRRLDSNAAVDLLL